MERMYSLAVLLGAFLFFTLVAVVWVVIFDQQNTNAQFNNVSAAVIKQSNKSSSATTPSSLTGVIKQSNKSSSATTPGSPFQGHSIKIFNVGGFTSKEWNAIDNYTSHGYEVKAVVPREDRLGHIAYYSVILETKG